MVRFFPDHRKTKKMCKNAVKKLQFVIKYAPDQYKTKEMCDKVFKENCGMLGLTHICFKDQRMCDKTVDNYFYALRFLKMCNNVVGTYPSGTQFVVECYNAVIKLFEKKKIMLKYCPDKYKTQKRCDEAINSHLLILKLVPDWFIINNMIEKLDNSVFSNYDVIFGVLDYDLVTFFSNDIGLNSINLNNVDLADDNFEDCDPETINNVGLMAWYNRYK